MARLSGTQSTRAPKPCEDSWVRRFNQRLPNRTIHWQRGNGAIEGAGLYMLKGGSCPAMRFSLYLCLSRGHFSRYTIMMLLLGFLPRPSRSPSMVDMVAKTCFGVSDLVFSPFLVATLLFPMSQSVGLSVGCQEESLTNERWVGRNSGPGLGQWMAADMLWYLD
ncbi:hypothetical protein GGR51DRAFT_492306 [Nemania sp. FL0031]|nr:hypothetical protein GGR51DRAFT_492306 [Nemania sp. FL0031]